MNVIARLEYELAYYDSAVHRFNHYTTRTPRRVLRIDSVNIKRNHNVIPNAQEKDSNEDRYRCMTFTFIHRLAQTKLDIIYFLFCHVFTKKICIQKRTDTDSRVYNKTIRFIGHMQKHASNDQENTCFKFVNISQMSVHLSWWVRVCLFSLTCLRSSGPHKFHDAISLRFFFFSSLRGSNFDIFR